MPDFRTKSQTVFPPLLMVLLGLCFVAKVVLLFFTIDRGFDIGDEGDLLLMYRNSNMYEYNFFAKFAHSLFIPSANPIVQYRVYKYAADLFSCLMLSWGLSAWFCASFSRGEGISFSKIFSITFLFSLLGFALSPYSPNLTYNDFTNVFMSSIVALMLILFSMKGNNFSYKELLVCFFIGFVFHLQATIKMEISIMIGVILIIYFLFFPSRKWQVKAAYLFSFWVGFWLLIKALGPSPHMPISEDLKHEAAYSIIKILTIYFHRDFYHLAIIGSSLAMFFLIRYLLKDSRYFAFVFLSLAIAFPLWVVKYFYQIGFYDLQLDIQLSVLAALFVYWFMEAFSHKSDSSQKMILYKNSVLIFCLALLPVILIVGTNSPLTQALPLVAFPWFAIAGILIFQLIQSETTRFFAIMMAIVLISSASYQCVHNRIQEPFMIHKNIFVSNVPNKYLYNIKTDSATLIFCEQLTKSMQRIGYKAGDTIVSMGFTSGLPYMLDARMELTAFYLPDMWGDHYNCFCLKNIPIMPAFLILPTDQAAKYEYCMKGSSRELSVAYEYVDSVFNPYVNTYYKNEDEYLRIYRRK